MIADRKESNPSVRAVTVTKQTLPLTYARGSETERLRRFVVESERVLRPVPVPVYTFEG
jgi:hypothetical protein